MQHISRKTVRITSDALRRNEALENILTNALLIVQLEARFQFPDLQMSTGHTIQGPRRRSFSVAGLGMCKIKFANLLLTMASWLQILVHRVVPVRGQAKGLGSRVRLLTFLCRRVPPPKVVLDSNTLERGVKPVPP